MIYFMRAGDDGPVKIGWTTSLEARKESIQLGSAVRLVVLRTLDFPRWAEYWLHDHFASSRLEGEWFSYDPTMLTITPPDERPRRSFSATSKTQMVSFRVPNEVIGHLEMRAKESGVTLTALIISLLKRPIDQDIPRPQPSGVMAVPRDGQRLIAEPLRPNVVQSLARTEVTPLFRKPKK
jgi:hypothetical protein